MYVCMYMYIFERNTQVHAKHTSVIQSAYILVLNDGCHMKAPWQRFRSLRGNIGPLPGVCLQHPNVIEATPVHPSIHNKLVVPRKGGVALSYRGNHAFNIGTLPLKGCAFFYLQ